MMSLTAPTLAETSGHWTHIVKSYSIAFLLSWVSSMFLAMLTSIYPNMRGNVAGLFSCHALINLTPWYRSLATVALLNSLSMKKPMTTCIFSIFIIGAIFLDTLRIFLRTRMHVSRRERSLSLRRSNLRNFWKISRFMKRRFSTFFIVYLCSSVEFMFFRL